MERGWEAYGAEDDLTALFLAVHAVEQDQGTHQQTSRTVLVRAVGRVVATGQSHANSVHVALDGQAERECALALQLVTVAHVVQLFQALGKERTVFGHEREQL